MSDPYSNDPWATETVADKPNTPETPQEKAIAAVTPSGRGASVVTTIKYGSGFDAPWTVIHSDTVEDALTTLNEARALLELTAKVAKFAKSLDSGTAPAAQRASGGGGRGGATSQSPRVPAKSCDHGAMTYRTGNNGKGPWAGHFCPLEKGDPDQCRPIFVNSN